MLQGTDGNAPWDPGRLAGRTTAPTSIAPKVSSFA